MTTRQKTIIWGWIAALIVMALWPPWIGLAPQDYYYGYRSIFAAEEDQRIDFARLALQCLVATLIAGGLYFAWPHPQTAVRNVSRPFPDSNHVLTWTDLAAEARSLSDRDFKACWQNRFLAPIRNIEERNALPGFVKLFLETAQNNDWKELRDILGLCLELLEGRVAPPRL